MSNPPEPYWYISAAILVHCPDQRCRAVIIIFLFFYHSSPRAVLWLSSSLSRIRKVRDVVTSYLSARCRLTGGGRGKFSPSSETPGFTTGSLAQQGREFQGTQEQRAVSVASRVCTQRDPQFCSPFNRVAQRALWSTVASRCPFSRMMGQM